MLTPEPSPQPTTPVDPTELPNRLPIKRESIQRISATIAILSLVTLAATFYFLPGLNLSSTSFIVPLIAGLVFFILYLTLPYVYLNETFLMVADAVYIAIITYAAVLAGEYGILILFLYFVMIVADALKYPLSEYVIVVLVSAQAAFFYIMVGSPFPLEVRFGILILFLFSIGSVAVFVWHFVNQTVYERSMRYVLERRSKYLKTMNDHLKAVDSMRSTMLRVTSHEFQTPLSAIRSSLSVLRDHKLGDLSPDQLSYVQAAAANNERLQRMIRDLLDASRIESGYWQLQLKEIDVVAMTTELLDEYGLVCQRQGLALTYDQPKEPITLQADRNLLRIAYKNLLDNASKYTLENGHITVSLTQTDSSIIFSVSDTGPGMDEKVISHLFSQFYRSDDAIAAEPNGFGIGLFHSRAIIRRHGGDITVKSQTGAKDHGSTFTITLPKLPDWQKIEAEQEKNSNTTQGG